MSSISVHIALDPENGGRPFSLARVRDAETIRHVASAAVASARARAERANKADPVLGFIEDDEVARLEKYFAMLVPGFSGVPQCGSIPPRIFR
jgi:hypothetical protein